MHAPAEVRNLDLAVHTNENVFGFDVAMHNVLLVQVFQSARHLSNVLRRLPFGESLRFPEVLVQFALPSEFEDEEDAFCVVKVAV
jgi:hypothetical protein